MTADERAEITAELEAQWEKYWALRQKPCLPTARHRREDTLGLMRKSIDRLQGMLAG